MIRAAAMRYSDKWVTDGRRLESPLLDDERAAWCDAGLPAAVHR